jgi:hypothetical protein
MKYLTLEEEVKRQQALMGIKSLMPTLNESINIIAESKQTEQTAINILKSVNQDDNAAQGILRQLMPYDTTKNQVLLPAMAKSYLENRGNVQELGALFTTVSDMVNSNKIGAPALSDQGYTINNKTFPDYLKFAEFIHGSEQMSKGHAEWKGSIEVETDEPPIWPTDQNNQSGIKIYDGNDVGKCIKYGSGGLTGKAYGFCIGKAGLGNMWQSYRDSKTSTFYYIVDSNRDFSDPLHIVVADHTQHGYELTDHSNSTGHIAEYGDDVDAYFEYLQSKGVPTNIFVNKPKTPDEISSQQKLGNQNSDLKWFQSLSYDEKSKYVGRGHLLSDEQFKYLWQFKNNDGAFRLLHQYVDTGQAIPEAQFNILVGEGG